MGARGPGLSSLPCPLPMPTPPGPSHSLTQQPSSRLFPPPPSTGCLFTCTCLLVPLESPLWGLPMCLRPAQCPVHAVPPSLFVADGTNQWMNQWMNQWILDASFTPLPPSFHFLTFAVAHHTTWLFPHRCVLTVPSTTLLREDAMKAGAGKSRSSPAFAPVAPVWRGRTLARKGEC